MKSTPPPPKGQRKRLTPGYPANIATVVNLPEPVLTYAGLVQEGVNGCLADTDEEPAEQAMRLLGDGATHGAFSENSVRLGVHHGIDAHVERIEALYPEAGEPSRPS